MLQDNTISPELFLRIDETTNRPIPIRRYVYPIEWMVGDACRWNSANLNPTLWPEHSYKLVKNLELTTWTAKISENRSFSFVCTTVILRE